MSLEKKVSFEKNKKTNKPGTPEQFKIVEMQNIKVHSSYTNYALNVRHFRHT